MYERQLLPLTTCLPLFFLNLTLPFFFYLHKSFRRAIDALTFPLMFEIYKPQERLKLNDSYRSQPQIASQMIREIQAMGFEIDCVLADSLYGESTSIFIRCLQGLNLQFAVAIRSNHGVRLPAEQRVRANKWRKSERIFAEGSRKLRSIRENIYGKKRELRYWEITTDIETIP
jgi:SRSO17 transposase